MEDLKTFIEQFRVKRGEPATHVSKTNPDHPAGSFYIPSEHLEDFLTYYSDAVFNGEAPSILELPGPYGPLKVDVDLTANLDVGINRQYDVKILKQIVSFYQNEIRAIVDKEDFSEDILWCIVLEKASPRSEEGKVKDGFHLHFPYFICDSRLQDNYLRPKITSRMIDEKVWEGTSFANVVDSIIDKEMASKPWMMYGSRNVKGNRSTPYLYNRWDSSTTSYGHAFDHNLKEVEIEVIFNEEMVGREEDVRYYLPRFMTIRGYTRAIKLIESVETKLSFGFKKRRIQHVIKKKRTIEEVLQDIKTIKDGQIMEMLSDERSDNRNEWMDVGWTLFNIGQGHEETLRMWIDFSQRSPKFKPGECEELWETMEMRDKTIGSLLFMAKADNPGLYKQWKDTNIRSFLYRCLSEPKPTEYDVAMVVVAMYKRDRFICADAKKDIWYEFRDHRWHLMDDNISLKNLLVEEVIDTFYSLKAEIAQQQIGASETERAKLELQEKRILAIISKLKTVKFHEQVIKMCKLKMYDSNFYRKMNENRMIITCENGVLDLDLGIFRDGYPDDYSTFSTELFYHEYNVDDEDVKDLDDFLIKVFPDENLRKYFITMASSCMQGGNINKRFIIGTGNGDNGKTITYNLIQQIFGEYCGKFPRELLIRGRGNTASSARPELAQVRGKRIMMSQEISHMDSFDIGVLKELTGNDSFFTRNIFEKGMEINPMFTLWMQCNAPPKIPGHDDATWSRIRLLDFESKFVKPQDREKYPVPESYKEQLLMKRFHADPNFKGNLNYLAPALLWKIFRHFPIYKRDGLIEPKKVMISTDSYKSENEIYLEFIRDKIEKEMDEEKVIDTFIRLSDMYMEFKNWYIENHPSYAKNMIGKTTMKNELTRRLGIIKDEKKDRYGFGRLSRWWGYRILQEEDQVEDVQRLLKN